MTSDTSKARQRAARLIASRERRKDKALYRVVEKIEALGDGKVSVAVVNAAQEVHADYRADWIRALRSGAALGLEVEVPEY